MSTSGRFLLLFLLLWTTSWEAPCLAGSRRGESVAQQAATKAPVRLGEAVDPQWSHREVSEAAPEPLPTESLGRATAKGAGKEPPADRRTALAGILTAPPLPSDILLLIQRQNE